MKILDPDDPFFAPPWRRYALVGFCSAWSLYEFVYLGSTLWGTMIGGLAVYAAWALFIARKPAADGDGDAGK